MLKSCRRSAEHVTISSTQRNLTLAGIKRNARRDAALSHWHSGCQLTEETTEKSFRRPVSSLSCIKRLKAHSRPLVIFQFILHTTPLPFASSSPCPTSFSALPAPLLSSHAPSTSPPSEFQSSVREGRERRRGQGENKKVKGKGVVARRN